MHINPITGPSGAFGPQGLPGVKVSPETMKKIERLLNELADAVRQRRRAPLFRAWGGAALFNARKWLSCWPR